MVWCDDHKEVKMCECGRNRMCFSCGIGSGCMPCDCTPIPKVEYPVGGIIGDKPIVETEQLGADT